MATSTIDYDALARQAGAINSQPATASGAAPGVDYDALAKQAGAVSSTPAQTTAPARQGATGVTGVLSGIGGGVFDTVQGAKKLVNKGLHAISPNAPQIPDVPADLRTQDTPAEKVGGFLENMGEFALGDEALKGAAKGLGLLEKMPQSLRVIAEAHPKLTKALLGITSSGMVGGAQGAVKGAAEGDATGGAEGGAAGGAIGGAVGEAAGPGIKALKRVFGLGLDSEEALVRGVKPSVTEDANFRRALQTAEPRIVEAAKEAPPKTVADFEDLLHNKAQEIRTQEFQPMIDRNANQMISTHSVAANIRSAATDEMRDLEPAQAKEIDDFAQNFTKDMSLAKAEKYLQFSNSQLKKFYALDRTGQHASLDTSGSIAKYEAAADGLRDVIYSRLKELGENAPDEIQKQYGALKTLERSVAKRATVSERQNPLSLQEILSLVGGVGEMGTSVATGHPLAALGGAAMIGASQAAKVLNSSDSLVKRGVQSMIKEGKPAGLIQKVGPAVGQAVKTSIASGASQEGRDLTQSFSTGTSGSQPESDSQLWIKFKSSNGVEFEGHPDDWGKIKKADPGAIQIQ